MGKKGREHRLGSIYLFSTLTLFLVYTIGGMNEWNRSRGRQGRKSSVSFCASLFRCHPFLDPVIQRIVPACTLPMRRFLTLRYSETRLRATCALVNKRYCPYYFRQSIISLSIKCFRYIKGVQSIE